jgi:predicted nucleic acid-binding protein
MVFVDTSVWSLAFRRSKSSVVIKKVPLLNRLISEDVPIIVAGIVMQELLSGLRETAQFKRLQNLKDFEQMAVYCNLKLYQSH